MSRVLALALQQRNREPSMESRGAWVFPRVFRASPLFSVLALSTVLLMAMYVLLINNLATKGYALHQLERQYDQLNAQSKELAVVAAQLQSFESLSPRVNTLSYLPAQKAEYLKTKGVVALNQ